MSGRTIGVGVISLGWMGRLHSRGYRGIKERFPGLDVDVQLVSACDPVEATREAAVKELGFRRAVVDYRDVINDPEVDVVSICSPNFLHREGPERVRQAYPGATWDRLVALKRRWDPTNLFRFNQNVAP